MLAEVVSYDPVRRKGFYFVYSLLPDELKSALREATARVRDALKFEPEQGRDDFKAASRAAVAVIKRQQFAMDVVKRDDGKWKITARTMEWLPTPLCDSAKKFGSAR